MGSATQIDLLLASAEPSLRYKVRVGVLGESELSRGIRSLRQEIRRSPRIATLLAGRARDGRLVRGRHVYEKWQGAHWVMAYSKSGVPVMRGRYRRCASQQGNALYAIVTLGLADKRTEGLVERLLHWQWPDGGWNCDKDPAADSSSFMETLTPMRGLAAYARHSGDAKARAAVERAACVFLDRQLFKRRSTGATIRGEFVQLHYPLYWHYDILGGLKVLGEAGMMGDSRCARRRSSCSPASGWPTAVFPRKRGTIRHLERSSWARMPSIGAARANERPTRG